jgi:hypothetical protein
MEQLALPGTHMAVLPKGFGNSSAMSEEVTDGRRHLQGAQHAIPGFLEEEPLSLLRAIGIPRGKNTGIR